MISDGAHRPRYTAFEIDQMRQDVRRAHGFSMHSPNPEQIERELLTHMANGTTPREVAELADEKEAERDRWHQWRDAEREARVRFCTHGLWGPKMHSYMNSYIEGSWACQLCGMNDRRKTSRDPEKKEGKRRGK